MLQSLMQRPDLAERPGAIIAIISIFLLMFALAGLFKYH